VRAVGGKPEMVTIGGYAGDEGVGKGGDVWGVEMIG
jgi:hypothetical protein